MYRRIGLKRRLPKEEVLFESAGSAVTYDLRNGFIFLDWRGVFDRNDLREGLEKAIMFVYEHLKKDFRPDLRVVRRNFYRLVLSLNRKWKSTYLNGSGEFSVIFYPTDLISGSALNYVLEKHRLYAA